MTRLDNASFRAQVPALGTEPLPTSDPSAPSTGVIVSDDFKTRVVGYWRYYWKPYISGSAYVWPDLSWRWPATKHPYATSRSIVGAHALDVAPGSDYRSFEVDITEDGFWMRGIPQAFFRTTTMYIGPSGRPALGGPAVGTPVGAFTAYLKFAWGGTFGAGNWNDYSATSSEGHFPSSSGGGFAQYYTGSTLASTMAFNSSPGVYSLTCNAVAPPTWSGGVRNPDSGTFDVGLVYGYYDPGAADTQLVGLNFSYPITSVLNPDMHYYEKKFAPGNGDMGKYTLVITSDGALTAYGMISGWNGGDPEWFAVINPFVYDNGPGNGSQLVPAITYYPPPFLIGGQGASVDSAMQSFNGWLHEYAISAAPYDTVLLGGLGSLQPQRGYAHLDQVRFKTFAGVG